MRRLLPLLVVALLLSCQRRPPPAAPTAPAAPPAPASLAEACANIVGAPRIEQVAPRVWVALGYDLANVILVRTSEGNVIIDAFGMEITKPYEFKGAVPFNLADLIF